jgi:hypothetical protein
MDRLVVLAVSRRASSRSCAILINDGAVSLGNEIVNRGRRWFAGSDKAAHGREGKIQHREGRDPSCRWSVSSKQPACDIAQIVRDVPAKPAGLRLHLRGPAVAQEILPAVQQHDAGALKILASGARQGERCIEACLPRVRMRQGFGPPVLEKGSFGQPEAAEQFIPGAEAMIDRPAGRSDRRGDCRYGRRSRAVRRGEPAKWRWVTPGAIVATAVWLLSTTGFSFYVSHFPSYNSTLDLLGSIMMLLTWFYLTAFAVLLGAELNAELERQTTRDTTRGREQSRGQRGAAVADTTA